MTGQEHVGQVVHGARSERLVAARARARRRRFLRALGTRASDLDAITRALLDTWSKAAARLDLYDEAGVLSRNGNTAANTEIRALRALEARLRELGLVEGRAPRDPGAGLRRHVEATYGDQGAEA